MNKFLIVPNDGMEASLVEKVTMEIQKQKEGEKIRIFDIDTDLEMIEEVDEEGNNHEVPNRF